MSSYAIAIRTLGRAGEKYKKLLDSIKKSKIRPKEVIVVLPEGYNPPQAQLNWERFVFCSKSMIQQRIEALKYITAEYTLFVDDDISFDAEFVEKILEPLEEGLYDCSTGPLFSFFPQSLAGKVAGTLTASVCISLFHRDMYVKILPSGGWSYHSFDTSVKHYYPTESFAWTCFMIRTEVMRNLRMEEEKIWIERYKYAYGDDRVMAYKLVKKGYKACIVSNALYMHNDAKTSTAASEMEDTLPVFCKAYMQTVFWHRFIQGTENSQLKRIWNNFWFEYWQCGMKLYYKLKGGLQGDRKYYEAHAAGIVEGKKYVNLDEYKSLPNLTD